MQVVPSLNEIVISGHDHFYLKFYYEFPSELPIHYFIIHRLIKNNKIQDLLRLTDYDMIENLYKNLFRTNNKFLSRMSVC